MRRMVFLVIGLAFASSFLWAQSTEVQFIFTSDLHYGIARQSFRGSKNVDAHTVDTALVAQMNQLQRETFPSDGGHRSAQNVGPVDFLAIGGDIANREEQSDGIEVQSAAKSWAQFQRDVLNGLT